MRHRVRLSVRDLFGRINKVFANNGIPDVQLVWRERASFNCEIHFIVVVLEKYSCIFLSGYKLGRESSRVNNCALKSYE